MEPYKTRDKNRIAVLIASGCTQSASPKLEHDGNVYFTFHDKRACEAVIKQHLSGMLALNSRDMIEALGVWKEQINNCKQSYGTSQ